ncbi:uncharacterized protein LOC18049585 isoform X2 [Citrus clementina]|uniref:uncharacterized protein LOC18049585 isoform X2 n=1 Tax=Citrus clementina TaxID=85681 RepID=UPI000CED7B11|nr:uncharacterized protein LOC18049585 isoform X2 [Citrus x clementina]
MTLNLSLCSPNFISSSSTPRFGKIHETSSNPNNNTSALLSFLLAAKKATRLRGFRIEASLSESENGVVEEELLSRVSGAKDASEVLEIVAESSKRSGGVLTVDECCLIINAAIDRGNTDLALSIFYAMRSSFDQGFSENGTLVDRWKWSRPDVSVYTSLVQSLAASLKVSDALRLIDDISRVGVSPGEEVPFGKVVRCPTCLIAVAVAQPQHGIQIVSCAKCRYKYELVSGDIVSIHSEEISMDIPAWKRGLRFLQIMKQRIPAAVHSIVVQTPSGMARTHRFATETVDLPAQVGERITVSSAAPSNVYREVGPFKFSPKALNFYPGEPLCLTNHKDGRESQLLRAPTKDRNHSLLNPVSLVPLLAVLATGDAASRVIDPSLPQFLSVAAVASLAVGVTLNNLIFPQLSQLPQKSVDTIAIRQQLLSQYDLLQSRIKDLKEAAEKEISSMIEIEIEMDSDVLAAESVSSAESISEQIQQIMELENLEEKWRLQAEANDEAERLINSQAMPTEQS